MPRSTKEWIGKNDDAPIPPRIKLRLAERANYTCSLCTRGAKPGEADHKVALILGGENRESNLQWLCIPCHRAKTKADMAYKSRAAKAKKRMAGIERKGRPVPGSKRSKWASRYNRETGRFETVLR